MSRIAAIVLLAAVVPASAQILGPTPYLCLGDSPLQGMPGLVMENCEDGQFNIPGVSHNGASVIGPSLLTDSVDCDDGFINGSGNGGSAFFGLSGAVGHTFTFNEAVLGKLPTAAGVVWTDGGGTITFEARDSAGVLIGSVQGNHADGSNGGETAEDRFYGVVYAAGIKSITIRNSAGGIETDHIQYAFPEVCYADCDASGTLTIDDFICYQTLFAIGDPTADCDASGKLDIDDFICFQTFFAIGC